MQIHSDILSQQKKYPEMHMLIIINIIFVIDVMSFQHRFINTYTTAFSDALDNTLMKYNPADILRP